jgi:hypothetical protein
MTDLDSIAEEIKATLVEAEFGARWGLIEAHHKVGELIIGLGGDRAKVVQDLAVRIERSARTLWYDVKFVERYPRLDVLPEGKVISWNKIITKYLTESKDKELGDSHNHEFITKCKVCGDIRIGDNPQVIDIFISELQRLGICNLKGAELVNQLNDIKAESLNGVIEIK